MAFKMKGFSGFKQTKEKKSLRQILTGRKKYKFGDYEAVVDRKGRVVKSKEVNPDGSVTKIKRSRKVRENQRYQ